MPEYRCRLIVQCQTSADPDRGHEPWYRDIVLPFVPYPELSIANIASDCDFDFVAEVIEWDHGNGRFNMVVHADLTPYGEPPQDLLGATWKPWQEQ